MSDPRESSLVHNVYLGAALVAAAVTPGWLFTAYQVAGKSERLDFWTWARVPAFIPLLVAGIVVIGLVTDRLPGLANRRVSPKRVEAPIDLTVTNDMGWLYVCNNGPRAEFVADVVGMTAPNGTAMNKQWSVIWAGQDDEQTERAMDIPTGVTRTLLLWKGKFINGPLMHPAVEFLPHPNSDYIVPTLDGTTISVRLRIVRVDPPGFTERTVTAGRSSDGGWIAEVGD